MARGSRYNYSGRRAASRAADAQGKLPVNSVLPAITGTAQVGVLLTCSTGTWSNTPDAFAYQWRRAGVTLAGATASTYTPVTGDIGSTLSCTVKATNLGVPAVATSAPTAVVIAA
jgi:hypothetical protein